MNRQQRFVREFCRMVTIDSPSYDEQALCAYLRGRLAELGLSVFMDNAGAQTGGSSGNLYGFLPGNTDGEPLLFSAHMDTVAPAHGKRAIVSTDGTIRSDGTTVLGADDLSGIAAILEALTVIRDEHLPHPDIEILLTTAEECYAAGAAAFDFSHIRAKFAYVLDAAGAPGGAVYAAPTILPFTVTVLGKAAHAGFEPEKGVHAFAAAAKALAVLPQGRINEETTVNFGMISGGTATNIIPDRCEIHGEIRSYHHEQALAELDSVGAAFRAAAEPMGAKAELCTLPGVRAYETRQDAAVIARFDSVCRQIGLTPELSRSFGGSDNNVLALHGITGIVVATGMHNCHTCSEYTTVSELEAAARLTLGLMTGILALRPQ